MNLKKHPRYIKRIEPNVLIPTDCAEAELVIEQLLADGIDPATDLFTVDGDRVRLIAIDVDHCYPVLGEIIDIGAGVSWLARWSARGVYASSELAALKHSIRRNIAEREDSPPLVVRAADAADITSAVHDEPLLREAATQARIGRSFRSGPGLFIDYLTPDFTLEPGKVWKVLEASTPDPAGEALLTQFYSRTLDPTLGTLGRVEKVRYPASSAPPTPAVDVKGRFPSLKLDLDRDLERAAEKVRGVLSPTRLVYASIQQATDAAAHLPTLMERDTATSIALIHEWTQRHRDSASLRKEMEGATGTLAKLREFLKDARGADRWDRRTYALGCLGCHAIAGRYAFHGDPDKSSTERLERHLEMLDSGDSSLSIYDTFSVCDSKLVR